ncbi:MAG: hypothetical protein K6T63_14740, partial [Alicyclobacillus herbarius]|uniref:hypothetical protein n=1 Tax=Alicyclobacillus herbarius TaxID=122960 RepID=UPI0023532270
SYLRSVKASLKEAGNPARERWNPPALAVGRKSKSEQEVIRRSDGCLHRVREQRAVAAGGSISSRRG